MDSRSSLKNHPRFQTKMGKVDTRFQTETTQKPNPQGGTYVFMPYLKEYPLGSVSFTSAES